MKKVIFSLLVFLIVLGCTQKTDDEMQTDDNKLDSEIINVNNKIKKCEKENDSHIGWNYCEELRMKIWHKKMTEYYKKLLKDLPSKYKQMLIDDQNNWLKWQKQHYEFLNKYMTIKDKNGTITYGNYALVSFYEKKSIIFQTRALELKALIEELNFY